MVMLEKKLFDQNDSATKYDLNGSETIDDDKYNDTNTTNTSGCDASEFTIKRSKEIKDLKESFSGSHLDFSDNLCSFNDQPDSTVMDVKTSGTSNMCTSSCNTACSSSQDVPAITSSGNGDTSKNGLSCALSSAASINTSNELSEVHLQQSMNDIPSDSSSITSNKENAPPSTVSIGIDIPPMSAISTMVGSAPIPATTASIQPLPSNMVNKTSFQMETQYMQQQSQIFVFSTSLANKAAESYLSGNFPSIIAFHCAQPGTKSFLEKYPLKVQQFNRQNPAAWLNSLAQMKQPGNRQIKPSLNQYTGPHTINSRFPGPFTGGNCIGCTGACSNIHNSAMCGTPRGSSPWSNSCSGPGIIPSNSNDICSESWSAPQMGVSIPSSSVSPRFPGPLQHGLNTRQMGPSGNAVLGCMRSINANAPGSPFSNPSLIHMAQVPGCPSSLTGVKVPDENLTPQQRQHREEQLAMIRKMQQLLFPEHQHCDQGGMVSNVLPAMGGGLSSQQNSLQLRFPLNESCVHSGVDGCFSPHQACGDDAERSHLTSEMYMDPNIVGTGFLQQNYPSVSAQLEWQKLQHQFYEERRKKQVCDNTSPVNSSPGAQIQTTVQQQITSPVQNHHTLSQPLTPQQQQNLNSPSPGIGLSPGPRMQGPPPPYYQTNRKTMPSPHPPSPNTSSLQSPRTASGLSSPADTSKQFPVPTPPGPRLSHPSPGSATPSGSLQTTPLNSPKPSTSCSSNMTHNHTPTTPSNTTTTPNGTPTNLYAPALSGSGPSTPVNLCALNRKQSQSCSDEQESDSIAVPTSVSSEFSTSTPVSSSKVQEIFPHDVHSCSQNKKLELTNSQSGNCQKEPNLMPVPSPQQIQYLNTFDGQELTIQKQPNTSIREMNIISPASITPSIAMSGGPQPHFTNSDATSFPNTPGSCPSILESSQDSSAGRYPSSAPASVESNLSRFTAQSPQLPTFESGSRHSIQTSQITDNIAQRFSSTQNMELIKISGPNSTPHNPLNENLCRFPVSGSQVPTFGPSLNSNVNMSRFPMSNNSETLQRLQNPASQISIDGVQSCFLGPNSHTARDNFSQSSQFRDLGQEELSTNQSQNFSASVPSVSAQNSQCMSNNFIDNMPHSHLHSLQKMTPPFENVSGSKLSSGRISPVMQCSNASVNNSSINVPPYGGTSPLTSSQVAPSQRLSHFDPIASMAAMSESTVSMASVTGNAQFHQTGNNSSMNVINMQIASNSEKNLTNSSFQTDMQNAPNTMACSMSNQHQFSVHNQIDHNVGCGSQSVNTTYASTTMSVQQLNIQNIVTSPSYTTCGQGTHVNPHSFHQNCLGNGANTLSCTVTTNHPIMHTAVTTRISNTNISMTGSRHGSLNFPGHSVGQRNASPTNTGAPSIARGSPFSSPNAQMKTNAPNTIQYLPARQQGTTPLSNRPPSIEFFQRFAAPLTNLDNKVPTHNLQYFPNSGNSNPPAQNINMIPASGTPNMMSSQRPMNMMGPMIRGANSNVSHPSGQIFPIGPGLPNSESQMFGRPPCPSMNNQMIPMSGSQGPGMFPTKHMPSIGGMAPDATQPLPPSMGQSFNYKQSPFYGPTTADPNYAVQFHNFQQQLYATNTRGSQMNSQSNISGQGFFGPK